MKISVLNSNINPLKDILNLLPSNVEENLTLLQLSAIKILFNKGGIECTSNKEVVHCLYLLKDMNVISIEEIGSNLKVKNLLW